MNYLMNFAFLIKRPKRAFAFILLFSQLSFAMAGFDTQKDPSPPFQLIQHALDKLDLVIHKEVSNFLYSQNPKKDLFGLAGFDNQDQGHLNCYDGYTVKDFYQFLGGIGNIAPSLQLLGAIGAAESKIDVHPQEAHAHYNSVFSTLGVSGAFKKFQVGFDLLAGYSFINAKHHHESMGSFKGQHNALSASVELKGTYKVLEDKTSLTPYDAISLFYNKEFDHDDKSQAGYTIKVENETLYAFRNELGFYINIPCTKSVDLFIDPSWLYETQLNSRSYHVTTLPTGSKVSIKQQKLGHNYGRLNTGFYVKGRRLDFAITYIGLWGRKYSDASTSLKLNLKL